MGVVGGWKRPSASGVRSVESRWWIGVGLLLGCGRCFAGRGMVVATGGVLVMVVLLKGWWWVSVLV